MDRLDVAIRSIFCINIVNVCLVSCVSCARASFEPAGKLQVSALETTCVSVFIKYKNKTEVYLERSD